MDEHITIAYLKRRLAESEARHCLLLDRSAYAVWETDASGIVVADSPSWRAYTGQTLEDWLPPRRRWPGGDGRNGRALELVELS